MKDVTIPEKMEVAVYNSNNDVRLMTTEVLSLSVGKLLIKTAAFGLCGGETMEFYPKARATKVLGHELTGTVVALGGRLITQKTFLSIRREEVTAQDSKDEETTWKGIVGCHLIQ